MPFPWAILIALIVLAFAYFIKHVLMHVLEDENSFLMIIGVFFVVYIAASVAVGSLNPVTIVNQGYLAATE